ncbi:PE family protein, partial [Mycobacterium ostraviense]|uniref:PE family protein n=1 Tax=Mycobacterium ostraviense TaxID=2738409 RepID=UPI0009E344EA
MSYVAIAPETTAAAAADLNSLGSTLRAANAAAAVGTTQLLPAAGDEVSVAIAAVFSDLGQGFQAVSAQTALFHEQFVQLLSGGGLLYAMTEAANASPLQVLEQDLLAAINAPTLYLFQRPLIGNGANGALPGQPGAPGGFLVGNGGDGAAGAAGQAGGQGGREKKRGGG